MAKYLFVYHGGKKAESEEDLAKGLDAWGKWFGSMTHWPKRRAARSWKVAGQSRWP
jgi:hypothetical protein